MDNMMKLASPKLLDIIDGLRGLGISHLVALPQLAVVGDQSSGKSSVLESFSGLPFPRDSGLCTRFATQIIFRRTAEGDNKTKITIIPGPDRNEEDAKKLRAYVKDGLVSLTSEAFLEILQEVCNLMGIPGPGRSLETGQSTFSDDLLSIEICGPQEKNLSIIDIPGIFRTPTEGMTTKDDILLVRKIMDRHIRDERTIILAVIPSNTDIATQEILSIAKELDPNGIRTLGVLTKPDLIDKGGEQNVMDLVENKRNPLKLGYCIVRNRGQSELLDKAETRRKKEEEFFNTEPWSRLRRNRVGTPALQERLQNLLGGITRREFPKLQARIEQQLQSSKDRLECLGPSRESTGQRRGFLYSLARRFQDVTTSALNADYSRHAIFDSSEFRLATLAAARMERYATVIQTRGHTRTFDSVRERATSEKLEASGFSTISNSENQYLETPEATQRAKSQYPELSGMIPPHEQTQQPTDPNIMNWLGKEYRGSVCLGLATIGPSVLSSVWQKQSKHWNGLTLTFVGNILYIVHDFIFRALVHLCPDEEVRSGLLSILKDQLIARYNAAIAHVKFIIEVEHSSTPMTLNHYYNENVQKCKAYRLEKLLEKQAETIYDHRGAAKPGKFIKVDQIKQTVAMDNSDHTIENIHDILKSYYKVARKRFVDAVCMQGVDFHLLTGSSSPLRIFDNDFVGELSDVQIDLIAGEDISIQQLRKTLENDIAALEKGKQLLRA